MTSLIEQSGSKIIFDYLEHWVTECPERVWLSDRKGDAFTEWSWVEAREELQSVAAWIEDEFGDRGARIALLSRNRAHWVLADMAIIASGNVCVPIFTTQSADTTRYIFDIAEIDVLFLGESANWESVRAVVPDHVKVVALPGIETDRAQFRWNEIAQENRRRRAKHVCKPEELVSLAFTSGTTGAPKGVMQNHGSMLIPMERARKALHTRRHSRFLSFLPLSHIAERQLVLIQSLVHCGNITFNEDLSTLVRDMADTHPTFFFGAPRVWEQLQQMVLVAFESQDALDRAFEADPEKVVDKVRAMLGLDDTDYLLTAAAPIPPALVHWWRKLGIPLREGYGQTEVMAVIVNTDEADRVGSIGKPVEGVELAIAENGELLCRAEGLSPGYYKMPEKTAETFVDGWVHTGDRARIDEDGFFFLTGRVKDYFKTMQGKFVAPAPIEGAFAKCVWIAQLCLLGRGYSKTAMVCVLNEAAKQHDRDALEEDLRAQAEELNGSVERHARIGAILVTGEPWTIENGALTPTLKIKRHEIEERFGERAQTLAHDAAVSGHLLLEWLD
jgi:long-chain acyl-CoA synthetase